MSIDRFLGFLTLGKDINKVKPKELETTDGIVSQLTPELTLNTSDDELIKLKKDWTRNWEGHSTKLRRRQDEAENYWKGKHPHDFIQFHTVDNHYGTGSEGHNLNDNLIFEALETFLPQATRKSPEPIVTADNTPEGQALSGNVRKMLIYLADILNFRLKIKSVVRNWALYFSGVAKIGWDFENEEISLTVLRPQKFILDPNATITEKGVYTGEYIGEFRKDTAAVLVERFPAKADFIKKFVQGKMGTLVQYIEWWADNGHIIFWTLRDEVLDKKLNPHWNYPEERTVTDAFGEESTESFTQDNHFKNPQFPYTFLSVFNLGLHPHDETSLIEQNIANQDLITKRYRQIDRNVDDMNGGWAISGELSGLTKEQSSSAIEAFRQGQGVWIPQGSVQNAVERMVGSGLPADVFNQLTDARNELRGIFGIAGSTPQGTAQEQTVRGKIIVAQQDQSRIGGGVAEYVEQFSDRVYNWFVQMMYVYYDEEHIASIIGRDGAQETVTLRNVDLNKELVISVKEGSMIPKDPLTQANQAIDLFAAGAIDPLELHTRLDDPNPQETAQRALQFTLDPASLLQGGGGGGEQVVPQQQGAPQGVAPPEQQASSDLLSSVPV